jgi:FkbM family methyltransferase
MNPRSSGNALREAAGLIRLIWGHPENRDRRARALGRFFLWQVWERLVGRPWTLHLTHDRILRCYPHSAGASGVLYCRLLEWWESRFTLDFLRPGDIFVDVGANVGVYSLLASTRPAVRVLAFEPSTLAYKRLTENIRLNGLGQIRAINVALGTADGAGLLTTDCDTTNRLVNEADGTVERVVVRSLDSFIDDDQRAAVALLKIDVEGHEPEVLAGCRRLLAAQSPALIVEQSRPTELRAVLAPLGYRFFRYTPDDWRLVEVGLDEPEVNVIAVRNLDAALERLARARDPIPVQRASAAR